APIGAITPRLVAAGTRGSTNATYMELLMSHLVDIFLQPSKVFVDLKEKPTFWLPLLLVSLASGVMVLMYYSSVDPEWFANHMLLGSGKELSAAEMEQVRASMPGARAMGYIGAPSAVIVTVVVSLLY